MLTPQKGELLQYLLDNASVFLNAKHFPEVFELRNGFPVFIGWVKLNRFELRQLMVLVAIVSAMQCYKSIFIAGGSDTSEVLMHTHLYYYYLQWRDIIGGVRDEELLVRVHTILYQEDIGRYVSEVGDRYLAAFSTDGMLSPATPGNGLLA